MDKRISILVVDDDQSNLELMRAVLETGGYQVRTADGGDMAFKMVTAEPPSLIILDLMMPNMDGYQVAGKLKADPATKNIPIIIMTMLNDRTSRLRALGEGAEEFLSKPVDRSELWVRVRNLLRLKEYSDFLDNYNQTLEAQVQDRTRALQESYIDTIQTLVRATEHKDEETGGHVKRISFYCRELALGLGMDDNYAETIHHASTMHDIGKIGIPDKILLKPGSLTPDEWDIMKTHTVMGAEILGQGKSASPFIVMGAEIALNHHERWDGSGYPGGLSGAAIPLSARIMALCDVYDALRSVRPYKGALSHAVASKIMLEGDGRTLPQHFDPAALTQFQKSADRFEEIYRMYMD